MRAKTPFTTKFIWKLRTQAPRQHLKGDILEIAVGKGLLDQRGPMVKVTNACEVWDTDTEE